MNLVADHFIHFKYFAIVYFVNVGSHIFCLTPSIVKWEKRIRIQNFSQLRVTLGGIDAFHEKEKYNSDHFHKCQGRIFKHSACLNCRFLSASIISAIVNMPLILMLIALVNPAS